MKRVVVAEPEWRIGDHVDQLARSRSLLGSFAEPAARKTSVDDHEQMYRAIEAGDALASRRDRARCATRVPDPWRAVPRS